MACFATPYGLALRSPLLQPRSCATTLPDPNPSPAKAGGHVSFSKEPEECAIPLIPGRQNRKRVIRYDKPRYRDRHHVENAFCCLKDFQRIANRYDKLAANFLSGVALATNVAAWL